MKYALIVFSALFFNFQSISQNREANCEEYSKYIFKLLLSNNYALANEFVDLIEYTAYIDRLEKLPDAQKENIKIGAVKSYDAIKTQFNKECHRILKIYKKSIASGASFTYEDCNFKANKFFKEIGFITVNYNVLMPGEEDEFDAIRFEVIKTANGWRILDGFFDE